MTERVRRRTSKWDVKEDPDNFSTESRHADASGRENEFIHDGGAKQDWDSSKNTGFRNSKWSDTNSKSSFKSEGNSRLSYWEIPAGSREEYKDDYPSRDCNEVSQTLRGWDGNRSYSTSMSPGPDDWARRSRSRSPKRSWSRSHRSRSRSPLYSRRSRSRSPLYSRRSRSRTPQYGLRSRSRSPPHGLKHDSEVWNERIGARSRVAPCYNFAKGRCTRGSQCRFLHEENDGYKDRRHSGSNSAENWGSRNERGSSYGYPNDEERDYSRDKLSHGHESQRNNRPSAICMNFVKGICHRGSSCRFLHEDSIVEGSSTGGRFHEGEKKPYVGHDYKRGSHKINTPCRYFSSGKCRMGTDCRFSHEGAVPDRPEGGGPADDRWGRKLSVENKSWAGPKWNAEATDPAHGSVGATSLDYRPDHIANTSWDDSSWNNNTVGQTWNETAAGNGRSEARSADERRGHNLGNEKNSWGGPKWGNEVPGSANGSVVERTLIDKTGCTTNSGWDEAAQYNQFPGPAGNQKVAADRPEGGPVDGKMDYGSVNENKLQERPKWTNEAADTAHVSVEGKSVVDGSGWITENKNDDLRCDKQLVGVTWNDKAAVPGVKRVSRWGNDDNKGQIGDLDASKMLGGTEWGGNATKLEELEMPEWKKENDVTDSIPPAQGSLDRVISGVDNHNQAWGFPTWSDKPPDLNMRKSPWTSDNNSGCMDAPSSRAHEEMLNFRSAPSTADGKDHYTHFTDNNKPRYGAPGPLSESQDISTLSHEQTSIQGHHTVPVYPDGQMHPASKVMMHHSASNMSAQSQQVPLPSAQLRSFDLNGPFEDLPSPNNQTHNMTGTIQAERNIDPKISLVTSGAPASQNVVTSEQVAQMSHISASLAQIFGNSHQLPQLYATLNSNNTMGLMNSGPNSGALGASFVQPNQDSWSQKQHDPVSNSMESSSLISTQTPAISGMPLMQNNSHDHAPRIPLQGNILTPVAAAPTGNDPVNSGNLEKEVQEQSNNSKQTENKTEVAQVVKEQDNTDVRMDEDGKKGKDGKGMRMFKFSLVEIVKEILKPTWKEGQLSKEAHKTIVKKVVDKVSGSVQGEHIQTQDKIDQYLSYSKNKLTKLVEAYVEKYLKG